MKRCIPCFNTPLPRLLRPGSPPINRFTDLLFTVFSLFSLLSHHPPAYSGIAECTAYEMGWAQRPLHSATVDDLLLSVITNYSKSEHSRKHGSLRNIAFQVFAPPGDVASQNFMRGVRFERTNSCETGSLTTKIVLSPAPLTWLGNPRYRLFMCLAII